MPAPPSSQIDPWREALERRIESLERWRRELAADETRARDEQRHAFAQMLSAGQNALERMIGEAVTELSVRNDAQMGELVTLNREQIEMLREARDERIRRRLREEEAEEAARKLEAAAKLAEAARKKVLNDTEITTAHESFRHARWTRYMLIVGPILLALGGIAAAAIQSHH